MPLCEMDRPIFRKGWSDFIVGVTYFAGLSKVYKARRPLTSSEKDGLRVEINGTRSISGVEEVHQVGFQKMNLLWMEAS